MQPNLPLIKITDLTVAYDGEPALLDAGLTNVRNEFLGNIGPNGGGKTTLVRALLGLITPQSGTIEYFDASGQPTDRLNIGYLPQYLSFDFNFPITVRDVVMSGFLAGKSATYRFTRQQRQQTDRVLRLFQLAPLAHKAIGQLSGGQRQRVLMARALVSNPDLLVLDEPSTYMDKESEGLMYDLLNRINSHCAIVLVSHDVGTIVRQVRNIACVNRTLHYHPAAEPTGQWFEEEVGCPFELVAHGHLPHRILSTHETTKHNHPI